MTRNALVTRTALAFILSTAAGFAQAPAAPAAAAPGARPIPTNLAPPPAPPGASGPDAPVGKVTQALEAKLASMMTGNGLTAGQVAERAVKSSSQIVAKRRSIQSADAQVDQASAGFYPSLNLSASYTRLSSIEPPNLGTILAAGPGVQTQPYQPLPAGTQVTDLISVPLSFPIILNSYVLQGRLNVPLSDYVLRTSRAVSGANRVKNASELDERATRLSVARDAKVAYYQWIRMQGFAFVGAQSIEQAKGHLTDSTNAFQAGLISKADVLRAQSGVKSAELFSEKANSNVALATQRLRVLMKDPAGKQYDVGENILAPVAPMPNTTSEEGAYHEAMQQRLELQLLTENEAAIRDQAALTRAGDYPRLDASAGAQYSNPNPRYFPQEDKFHGTWEVGATLSWTPTAIFGVQAASRSLDAKAAELQAQRQALLDSLQLEVSQALSAERDAQFAVTVTEQALASAEEGYRVRRELFRSGKATLVEVTDSETELTRARLELVNAHVDLRIAQVELAHVLGRDAK